MPSFHVNAKWAALSEIIPGLYICGVSALKPQILAALDINLIVNCTKEVPNMNLVNCERMKLWLDDTDEADLDSHLDLVTDHIHLTLSGGGKALVHCVAGVSRSAAMCMAYLVKYEGMSLRKAYRLMAARRPVVRPNLGFWRQLIDFERRCRPGSASSVKIVPVTPGKSRCVEGGEKVKSADFLPDVYLQEVCGMSTKSDSFDHDSEADVSENETDKENLLNGGRLCGSPPPLAGVDLSEKRRHSSSGSGRVKFVPRLPSVPESDK